MHMPGHKRNLSPAPGLPYEWDLTEVEGADDLHHAQGILKDAMDRTAELWGSRRTWYLVNGSTCGILASIYAAVPYGGEAIIARNCHKSVFHAVEIQGIHAHWLMPEYIPGWDICGSVVPENVEKLLKRYPDSSAVILTSPTYEGVVSDIASIAAVCHQAGVPLIVDEAHGAHFGFSGNVDPENERTEKRRPFPESALHLGADLVIQSAHKTLPSLTQTAFLHMGCDSLISEQAVEHALDIYETSSPSYPLMASLDGCTGLLKERGAELYERWERGIRFVEDAVGELINLKVFHHTRVKKILRVPEADRNAVNDAAATRQESDEKGCDAAVAVKEQADKAPEDDRRIGIGHPIYDYDCSKFLIRADERLNVTGKELADLLRSECGIESEMHCGRNVLLMTGCGDAEEGFRRLADGLRKLDGILGNEPAAEKEICAESDPVQGEDPGGRDSGNGEKDTVAFPESCKEFHAEEVCTIREAVQAASRGRTQREGPGIAGTGPGQKTDGMKKIPLSQAAGQVSAEYVMAYPPGIPILIPGERITDESIRVILSLVQQGSEMRWSVTEQQEAQASCVAVLDHKF